MEKYTIEYKRIGSCVVDLDVYPVQEGNAPVLLFLHGGALIWGSKDDIGSERVQFYQELGFTVISANYRLAPETKLAKIIEDLDDLMKWAFNAGAKRFGYDRNRIAVVGQSAGGYLALLTGTLPTKPNAIVSFYGYGDILADWYTTPSVHYLKRHLVLAEQARTYVGSAPLCDGERQRFSFYLYCRQHGRWVQEVSGLKIPDDQGELEKYCPVLNIGEDYPPTLLIHGDQDTDVPYEESLKMHNALKKHGLNSELYTVSGGGHAFEYFLSKEELSPIFKRVSEFLKESI